MKEQKKSKIEQSSEFASLEKKMQNGITLIALVISIIVMLILAGVSINAIVGENGILTRTQYASFLNEMSAVEEAVQMWKAGEAIDNQGETKAIPANGLCKANDLTETERLVGEVGYYRNWSMTDTVPITSILSNANDFNSSFESEIVFYPAGVQDLYYLNNSALGIKESKTYLIDAATGMVYSMTGIGLKGVICYSSNMAKAVMNGDMSMPQFATAEVSGSDRGESLAGNPDAEYGFQMIADYTNNNIYKLYNNGDLYGKGIKGNLLNTPSSEMDYINEYIWAEMIIPNTIPDVQDMIVGDQVIFVVDGNKDLWAWGVNAHNYLGLTESQQNEYTGREAVKLDIKGKKVFKCIYTTASVWIITMDNELYVCGLNAFGELGVGNCSTRTDSFIKVEFSNPQNILMISAPWGDIYDYGTIILMKDGSMYFSRR